MKDYTCVYTPKYYMPMCYLRVPPPSEGCHNHSRRQSEDFCFGDEEIAYKVASDREERGEQLDNDDNRKENEAGKARGNGDNGHEIEEAKKRGFSLLTRGEFLQDIFAEKVHTCPRECVPNAETDTTHAADSTSLSSVVVHDSWRHIRNVELGGGPYSPPSVAAAACEGSQDSYRLFYEDEEALAGALVGTTAEFPQNTQANPSSVAAHTRAGQMFSCAAAQAATPPSSQRQQQSEPHQNQSEGQPQHETEQPRYGEEEGALPTQVPSSSRQRISWSPDIEERPGSGPHGDGSDGGSSGESHRRQQPLRSYSMLDIENDAFTGVHENDVESEAGQCLRNMKVICGFCLLCYGIFLLVTCPKMRRSSPLVFYYILCTMSAELGIALCFGCSICLLACLVGEQGAVYANATCGLLHRVVEGIAHYTFTGIGGYLLFNFTSLEGVWYATGEEEQEKFWYLLIYVGCEATISLLYSLQTLRTLFGVCRFIVTKVYAKITGRGDVYFLHGDAPVIYASIDQYRQALARMRNPVDVAFLRRHPQHEHGLGHPLSIYRDNTDKDTCYV